MKRALNILALDSIGGLLAGAVTVLAAPRLTDYYGWPEGQALCFGWVNLSYGCYSGTLALYLRRKARLSRWAVIALIAANGAWTLQCFTRAWLLWESASPLGIGQLLLEGLWVGALAYVEARFVLPCVTAASRERNSSKT